MACSGFSIDKTFLAVALCDKKCSLVCRDDLGLFGALKRLVEWQGVRIYVIASSSHKHLNSWVDLLCAQVLDCDDEDMLKTQGRQLWSGSVLLTGSQVEITNQLNQIVGPCSLTLQIRLFLEKMKPSSSVLQGSTLHLPGFSICENECRKGMLFISLGERANKTNDTQGEKVSTIVMLVFPRQEKNFRLNHVSFKFYFTVITVSDVCKLYS